MNERIRELVAQAEAYAYGCEEHWNDSPSWQELFNKKFAELIVQECALYLHRRGVEGFGILEERNLKEHFGVEE